MKKIISNVKVIIFTLAFLYVTSTAFAANKYYCGTGNWSTAANWRTTGYSGGACGATATTVPTTSDIAYLDAGTGTLTVDSAAAVAQQTIHTGFTGTLDISGTNKLTISSNVTLVATATYSGDGQFSLGTTSTGTITTAGISNSWTWVVAGTGVKNLVGNITCAQLLMISGGTWNGYVVYPQNGLVSNTTTNRILYGSSEIRIQGGAWYYVTKRTAGKIVLDGNVHITGSTNTSSTVGIYDSTLDWNSGTVTVETDTIFNINGTSSISAAALSHITFENVDTSGTLTLLGDLNIAKSLGSIGTTSWTLNGDYSVNVGKNLIMYNAGHFIAGTGSPKIVMNGTGMMFSGTSFNGMTFYHINPIKIDTEINTAGTITFLPGSYGTCKWGASKTLTYVDGTMTIGTAIFDVMDTGYAFDLNDQVTLPTLNVTAGTASLTSDFTATVLRQTAGTTIDVGTSTLTVASNLYVNGTDSTTTTISSASTGYLVYSGTATNQKIFKGTFTNIDASSSAIPIYSWHGTVTGSTNVFAKTGANIKTLAYASA